jgi:hypothetical protein
MNWNRRGQAMTIWTPLLGIWFLALALTPTMSVAAGNHIDWQVVASAGPPQSSAGHKLFSVTGQPSPVGEATSSAHRVRNGFMQAFTSGGCCVNAGDANHDTKCNVSDAVFVISYVFKGGAAPSCKQEGDANADTKVNVSDAVYIISYVFKGGAAPKCGP